MKHHPDIEPAESSKEEFSRVCEAYEVLSSGEYQPDVEWCGMQGSIHISTRSLVLAADNSSKLLAAAVSHNQASRCSYWVLQHGLEAGVVLCAGAASTISLGSPAQASLGDVAALPLFCVVAKLKGTYDLYGEEVLKSTAEGAHECDADSAARLEPAPPAAAALESRWTMRLQAAWPSPAYRRGILPQHQQQFI
jgi:hypothetical protein